MDAAVYNQSSFPCRLLWGRNGAQAAVARGDILVIVDVLSFSSTAATAANQGVILFPVAPGEDTPATAARVDAVLAVGRREVSGDGEYSLSPLSYLDAAPGSRVLLASPNGAALCRLAATLDHILLGCLLNATATAKLAEELSRKGSAGVTVLAAGEQWPAPTADGPLRFAVEDYLGAGAILAGLSGEKSPDAMVCEAAFRASQARLADLIWDSPSGIELRERGCPGDVRHACEIDRYLMAVRLKYGHIEAASS